VGCWRLLAGGGVPAEGHGAEQEAELLLPQALPFPLLQAVPEEGVLARRLLLSGFVPQRWS